MRDLGGKKSTLNFRGTGFYATVIRLQGVPTGQQRLLQIAPKYLLARNSSSDGFELVILSLRAVIGAFPWQSHVDSPRPAPRWGGRPSPVGRQRVLAFECVRLTG